MRTFYDVVNYLKGDLENGEHTRAGNRSARWPHIGPSNYGPYPVLYGLSSTSHICSIEKFNKFIAKKEKQYAEYKKEFEMAKTVTHDGKVYDIGGLYIGFSNQLIRLDGVSNGYFIGVDTSGNPYRDQWLISVDQSSVFPESKLGTITPAPADLVDGAIYQFDFQIEAEYAAGLFGVYDKSGPSPSFTANVNTYEAKFCTNIVRLVPEAKAAFRGGRSGGPGGLGGNG